MQKNIIIIGAGGHGLVLYELAKAIGHHVIGFIDDHKPKGSTIVDDCTVLGDTHQLDEYHNDKSLHFVLAMGDNKMRQALATRYKTLSFVTLVHPSAYLSPSSTLGEGTVVLPHVIVQANAVIGDHVILNNGAIIEHDVTIEDYTHIGSGCVIGSNATVRQSTTLDYGVVAKRNTTI